ncbi:hypothetical protein D3C74_384520 [compost metagenome]
MNAQVGDLQCIGNGHIRECKGRGPGHRARHIRYSIMDNSMLHIGGIFVGGDPVNGFYGTALINCNIHNNGAFRHLLHHVLFYQLGCPGTWNQYGTDQQIRFAHSLFDVVRIRHDGNQTPAKNIIKSPEPVRIPVQHGNSRPEAKRNLGRVGAHNASTQDHHLTRLHTGNTAEQHAFASLRLLQ